MRPFLSDFLGRERFPDRGRGRHPTLTAAHGLARRSLRAPGPLHALVYRTPCGLETCSLLRKSFDLRLLKGRDASCPVSVLCPRGSLSSPSAAAPTSWALGVLSPTRAGAASTVTRCLDRSGAPCTRRLSIQGTRSPGGTPARPRRPATRRSGSSLRGDHRLSPQDPFLRPQEGVEALLTASPQGAPTLFLCNPGSPSRLRA